MARVRGLVALEMAAQLVGGVGVERGGGLVEQQELGLVDQRLGEQHAGLLPGREPAERAVEERLAGRGRGQSSAIRSLRPRHGVELGVDAQVLAHGQPLRQVDIGAGEVHPRQDARSAARGIGLAQDADRAGAGLEQAQQHGDGRGLAGAVGAEQRHGPAPRGR